MKNTVLLLLLFLLVGSLTFYFFKKEDKKTTILTEDGDFAVKNIDEIRKIRLSDKNGTTTVLEKKSNHWQVNEQWKANPNAINNLLETIQRVSIKYIPPRAAVPNILKDIATNKIKVETYNQTNRLLKSYYVGGVTNDELGTHMIMVGATAPFVTHIPGFEGTLRARYLLDEYDWRDKTIFQEKIDNIQSLSIEYPKQKNKSFLLERRDGAYEVLPFYESTPKYNRTVEKGLIEKYLVGYDHLVAEAFENNNPLRDSISRLLPFSTIRLKTVSGAEKELRLYPIVKTAKNGQQILNQNGKPLVEKYFASVNGEDFMLIQHLVFGKILWAYEAFFQ